MQNVFVLLVFATACNASMPAKTDVDDLAGVGNQPQDAGVLPSDGAIVMTADLATNANRNWTMLTFLAGADGVQGAADGTGTAATFKLNHSNANGAGITTDGTDIFVADCGNESIRKVDPATGVVTTLAALGNVEPMSVVANSEYVYVVTTASEVVMRVAIAGGAVTTIAGLSGTAGTADGSGNNARFTVTHGIALDAAGNLYVTDTGKLRKIVPGATAAATVVSTIASTSSYLGPLAVNAAGTAIYFSSGGSDYGANDNVQKYDVSANTFTTFAGTPGHTGTDATHFDDNRQLTLDEAGNALYVSDWGNGAVRKIALDTHTMTTLAGVTGTAHGGMNGFVMPGALPGKLNNPGGLVVLHSGVLALADRQEEIILLVK